MTQQNRAYMLIGYSSPNEFNIVHISLSESTIRNYKNRYEQLRNEMPQLPEHINPFTDDKEMCEYFKKQKEWHDTLEGFKPHITDLICYDSYFIDEMELI